MSQQIKPIIFDSRVLVGSDEDEVCEAFQEWSLLSREKLYKQIFENPHIATFEKGGISPEIFYSIIMSRISPMEKKPSPKEFHVAWGNTFTPRAGIENIMKRIPNKERVFLTANTDVIRWSYLQEKLSIINPLLTDTRRLTLSYLSKSRGSETGLCLKAIERTKLSKPERKHILYVSTEQSSIDAFSRLGVPSVLYNPEERLDVLINALRSQGVW